MRDSEPSSVDQARIREVAGSYSAATVIGLGAVIRGRIKEVQPGGGLVLENIEGEVLYGNGTPVPFDAPEHCERLPKQATLQEGPAGARLIWYVAGLGEAGRMVLELTS